jgi:hypothetical protein
VRAAYDLLYAIIWLKKSICLSGRVSSARLGLAAPWLNCAGRQIPSAWNEKSNIRANREESRIMVEYKGYFIRGTALMVHPHSPDWRALGTVFSKTPQGTVVAVERVGGPVFTVKEAAEKHGLILCQAWIDEKLDGAQGAR